MLSGAMEIDLDDSNAVVAVVVVVVVVVVVIVCFVVVVVFKYVCSSAEHTPYLNDLLGLHWLENRFSLGEQL
jgi:heme/copper-type cytochrome/quinol oxidase subunit 2